MLILVVRPCLTLVILSLILSLPKEGSVLPYA